MKMRLGSRPASLALSSLSSFARGARLRLAPLVLGAVAAVSALGAAGCSAATDEELVDELGESEDLVTGKDTAGIVAGSPEEAAILLVANDRSLDTTALKSAVKITATATKSLLAFRAGPTDSAEDDGWFLTLAELDKQRGTTKTFYARVGAYAKARGYVDSGDLVAPDRALLEIPDNLGRPPTSNDVRVVKGFDGLAPDQAFAVFRGRSTNYIHPQNERLIQDTFAFSHKAFTIALGNFFAEDSPPQRFLRGLGASKVVLLGLLRQLTPVAIEATFPDGRVEYYMKKSVDYERVEKPTQRVIMRSPISLEPFGVRVFYPAWGSTNLKSPVTVVVEG
ncbi:MAG TPA: hypothetical protein PLR99_09785 [Polyangiaceae bacterium]|nr:hypothetical protein [Polyangiaceae bacterium]